MKSILEHFANGDLNPLAGKSSPGSPYAESIHVLGEKRDELEALLSPEQSRLLEEYAVQHNETDGLNGIDDFICGFKIGMRMAIEVFEAQSPIMGVGMFDT